MTSTPAIPTFTLFGETEMFPDVVHCEQISDRAPLHSWTISPHRHAQMSQLFLITKGHVTGLIDGHTLDLDSGGFAYIPAQSVHSFRFAPATAGLVISFPIFVINSVGPSNTELANALTRTVIAPSTNRLSGLAHLLADLLSKPDPFRAQAAVGLAHSILSTIAAINARSRNHATHPHDHRLNQLDTLILSHLGQGWRAREYAAAMSVTTGHLARLCRAAKGIGTTAYIESVLMQEACRMLAFTRMPAAEVGYRLGFHDPSYFSRRFRIAQGTSPSDYRRKFASA